MVMIGLSSFTPQKYFIFTKVCVFISVYYSGLFVTVLLYFAFCDEREWHLLPGLTCTAVMPTAAL